MNFALIVFTALHQMVILRPLLLLMMLVLVQCRPEECAGNIEAVVQYEEQDTVFGGTRSYVDIKNKDELGIRTALYRQGKLYGTFNNVVIVNDFRNKLKGRKWICFGNDFKRRFATDGARLNEENIPEIEVYD